MGRGAFNMKGQGGGLPVYGWPLRSEFWCRSFDRSSPGASMNPKRKRVDCLTCHEPLAGRVVRDCTVLIGREVWCGIFVNGYAQHAWMHRAFLDRAGWRFPPVKETDTGCMKVREDVHAHMSPSRIGLG